MSDKEWIKKNVISSILFLIALIISTTMMVIGVEITSYLFLIPSVIVLAGVMLVAWKPKKVKK